MKMYIDESQACKTRSQGLDYLKFDKNYAFIHFGDEHKTECVQLFIPKLLEEFGPPSKNYRYQYLPPYKRELIYDSSNRPETGTGSDPIKSPLTSYYIDEKDDLVTSGVATPGGSFGGLFIKQNDGSLYTLIEWMQKMHPTINIVDERFSTQPKPPNSSSRPSPCNGR